MRAVDLQARPGGADPGDRPGQDWFAVAQAVGDRLVPSRADWVLVHVRSSVLQLVRAGRPEPLRDAGIGAPEPGEPLSIVVLRHRDPDPEVALHGMVQQLAPRVGDPYGSGRVTATGVSRLASQVDPAHLRAIATDPDNLCLLQALDLGSAVIAPVTVGPTVIGALNLVWSRRSAASRSDLADAEELGRWIGAALDRSLPATALLERAPQAASQLEPWSPPAQGNPVAAARAWARRALPEVVDRPTRADLADDLDLVVSELVANALRHTESLRGATLEGRGACVRVAVLDGDDRSPTLRAPGRDLESGRGLLLIDALSAGWAVWHDVGRGGKSVWADLLL
jgi:anti-sigma regulatory factor (Ser/Thr protein kinase)